ncbi:MAG: chorismate-binding protein [Planctomycetes bacterium]|nr:chorismate-binding protein [Planctomycetota bacterium]
MTEFRVRVLEELPAADPAAVLRAVPRGAAPVWLDDAERGGGFLAWNPDARVSWRLPALAAQEGVGPGQQWPLSSDPVRDWVAQGRDEVWSCEVDLPWFGGWLGFLGFELGHSHIPFPWTVAEPSGLPHGGFARYPYGLWLTPDTTWVLGVEADAVAWRQEVEVVFRRASKLASPRRPELLFRSQTQASQFQEQVCALRSAIGAGELFQANLSHRLSADFDGDPREAYCAFRPAQPTQMSAYWEDEHGRAILSWSPERFLSMRGSLVQTRPIKGTAPRGHSEVEDLALAQALDVNEKERAELTMIVDMARNDLGQIAQAGRVRVLSSGEVEAYPTLFHRTATVEAELRSEVDLADVLRATFPPASVTGAPKVRALQAISELEREQRGAYCGAFGIWVPGAERADFSVLIRTAVVAQGAMHLRVGAGIVWDSDPAREWQETWIKARYLESQYEPTPF